MNFKEELQEKQNKYWQEVIDEALHNIKIVIEGYLEGDDYTEELVEFELTAKNDTDQISIDLDLFPTEIDGQIYVDVASLDTMDILTFNCVQGVYVFIEKIIPILKSEGFIIIEKTETISFDSLNECKLIRVAMQL